MISKTTLIIILIALLVATFLFPVIKMIKRKETDKLKLSIKKVLKGTLYSIIIGLVIGSIVSFISLYSLGAYGSSTFIKDFLSGTIVMTLISIVVGTLGFYYAVFF